MIHLDYFQANVAIDPTMIDARGIESEEDYIRKLLKEIPEECNSIGLDVKGYWVEENQVPRLRAWEGRRIRDGRRIDESAKQELIAQFPATDQEARARLQRSGNMAQLPGRGRSWH